MVLQGDNTERDGFHLENVSNVLIRGFTVRDFGVTATTAAVWGLATRSASIMRITTRSSRTASSTATW